MTEYIILSLIALIAFIMLRSRLQLMENNLKSASAASEKSITAVVDALKEVNKDLQSSLAKSREENLNSLFKFSDLLGNNMKELGLHLKNLKDEVEKRLSVIQKDNQEQLDKMRATVEEKLQTTLEKRLGDSFKLVSERLDVVHRGLGEMQTLAEGVGDLKKVLTNVKLRGTWGEVQLGNILNQLLTSEQFYSNVVIKPHTSERVEYAIRLPGKDTEILLPIDSKFPIEDYHKILESQDQEAIKQLELRIKFEAKSIFDKYIDPPRTTDFAILFLPTEGLYAEILRIPGLFEFMQREYRVIVSGPWTLAAILNSLQLGFKTLAIQKRTSEVWEVLGGIKREFGKFGDLLDKTHKKLIEAGNVIESASKKTRSIERRLNRVESISSEADLLLEEE